MTLSRRKGPVSGRVRAAAGTRRRQPLRAAPAEAAAATEAAGRDPLRSREAFFASISHELRTPLNAILGFNRLARADLPADVDRSHLDHIDEAASVMLRVVNDLLDLAQLEAGRLEIEPDQPLSLNGLFVRVCTLGAGLRQDKPIRLYTQVDPGCPDALRGDRGRIEQVLINLLGNALKFTERGLVVLKARLRSRQADHVSLRLSVADTGAGIDMAQLDRLGRPFERATGAGGPSGTGLGLAVVRRLLELHGTELHVASVTGGGTIMWFDIDLDIDTAAVAPSTLAADTALFSFDPRLVQSVTTQWRAHGQSLLGPEQAERAKRWIVDIDDPQAPALIERARREGRTLHRVSADPTPAGSGVLALPLLFAAIFRATDGDELPADPAPLGLRVLVLEDNPLNQRVLLQFLQRMGVDCLLAADGEQALAALAGAAFDAALLDIQLPGISGLETARQMRQLPQGRRLPLVFLSAHLSGEERLQAAALDALACLGKPLDPDELQATLRRLPPAGRARRPEREAAAPPPGTARANPPGAASTASTASTASEPRSQLQQLFAQQWPAQRARLHGETEAQTLLQTVHALRGSLSVLGASAALRLAREVEEGLRAGQPAGAQPLAALRDLGDALAAD